MQPDLLLCFVKEIGVDLGANMINRDVNTNCESIWSSDGDSFFIGVVHILRNHFWGSRVGIMKSP